MQPRDATKHVLIDCTRNEAEVGSAVRKSGIPREEIFVTTKVTDEGYGGVLLTFEYSYSLQKGCVIKVMSTYCRFGINHMEERTQSNL